MSVICHPSLLTSADYVRCQRWQMRDISRIYTCVYRSVFANVAISPRNKIDWTIMWDLENLFFRIFISRLLFWAPKDPLLSTLHVDPWKKFFFNMSNMQGATCHYPNRFSHSWGASPVCLLIAVFVYLHLFGRWTPFCVGDEHHSTLIFCFELNPWHTPISNGMVMDQC